MPARRLAFGAVFLVACSSGTAPASVRSAAASLTAGAAAGSLAVTNTGSEPVCTLVLGREAASRVNWAPCVDTATCPPLAPGATRRVAYPGTDIPAGEQEAVVYWWYVRQAPGDAPAPDSIRALVVPLR